jgi:branched-chain amino acid transport system permease protein
MSTVILLVITGLGLGALYFLVASGLSLIYGLMGVLNFAHGSFLTISAFLGWEVGRRVSDGTWWGLALSAIVGIAVGAIVAALTEYFLIRRLYERHIEQALVTVGLALASVALFEGIWGTDPIYTENPAWLEQTTEILGAKIPNDRFLLIACAALVLGGIVLFLQKTRYGLIIRAGVENRSMVTALGIDVRRSFTLVFAIGGAAAGLGGVLASVYYGYVSAHLGSVLLIFAFIVTVIGGLGSLTGAAVASVLVAVLQQFANFYFGGTGDLVVVIALAVVLRSPAALAHPGRHRARRAARDPPAARDRHPGRPARAHVHAGHLATARVRHAHRGARAQLSHDVRAGRPALVRACAVLRGRCVRPRHGARRVRPGRVAE